MKKSCRSIQKTQSKKNSTIKLRLKTELTKQQMYGQIVVFTVQNTRVSLVI